ncbi:TPA: Sec-independent protein translocase protein TatB [Stenotrophomonas maltophilia]|uniref:Sec-independent protein translocase protein TatB n=1 Tax=Stenotrophomonas maltophilia TaxID=40324 RepID=A0AAI9G0T2_STEMA|nr:Sec-independent protein translocase protein TatB [Stenotrophomonas maltophilia]EKT4442771.1 twin-arginine translocase subunit TatB [Stenotrophomonas maltophilia]MBN5014046.1 twin-arginine translocase subunit TatB [Stenotrophomonas maltophilia]HDS1083880.1 twin-arginine translocase subunit TatB [Stenotrophomonas maltophilia]HDS1303793.1 twin-arginine translocase subunit TatB [Stenotrophomonas maltophilia]HDS1820823.1 twin-arginine translocase subunit TatB [Stenotrophomonas maltophilia]
MFDIGFSELLVIAVVALVVLGPERLPKAARFAGLWVRRARNQWDSVKQELERELQAEDIKRQMQDVRQGMQDTENQLRASGEAIRREAQQAQQQGDTLAQEVRSPAPADLPPHMSAAPDADAPVQESTALETAPATTPEAGATSPAQSTERQP